ncbi:MAG: hypothetical protein K6C95_07800 [Lachnospiraceae bacterium]|nr:hypothetical protein [Lachnospiraceae bacterium]
MQHIEDMIKMSDFSRETDLEPKLRSMLKGAAKKKVSLGMLMEQEGVSAKSPVDNTSKTRTRQTTTEKKMEGRNL